MSYAIAILAALGAAVCFGLAAVLEQIGARREATATHEDPHLIYRVLQQGPYNAGLLLSAGAWALTIVAVQSLPLFFVQAVASASIAVTVLGARYLLHTRLRPRDSRAIGIIFLGLVALGLAAAPSSASPVEYHFQAALAIGPFILALLGVGLIRHRHDGVATAGLALLSGLAFSGAAICGRVLTLVAPGQTIFTGPTLWILLCYGFVGMLLFTIALQRGAVTTVNAIAFAVETLVPAVLGLIFLGDTIQPGLEAIMVIGLILVTTGTTLLALGGTQTLRARTIHRPAHR